MADTAEERQMLAEVQAYITARNEAETSLRDAERDLVAKYPRRYDYDNSEETRTQRVGFHREMDEAHAKSRVTVNEAWNGIKQASDPLARWIAENCKDYQGEALIILKALPATLAELDELADDQDFCNIWDQFRGRAQEAGVLPGAQPETPARKAVVDFVTYEACLDRRGRRRLNTLLDALLAEAA